MTPPGQPMSLAPIRARRAGGKLLNLDRMLLNSPAFAQAWNTMFGTIRQKLAVPPKLRELGDHVHRRAQPLRLRVVPA